MTKKKIKNTYRARNLVLNTTNPVLVKKLYIDFNKYPNWTHSYKGNHFTNALKDSNVAAKHFFFLIDELFGDVQENIIPILAGRYPHCHPIKDEKKRKLVIAIVQKLHHFELESAAKIWELSAKRNIGIRVIGIVVTNEIYNFIPLFIDHNHLLYPSSKHNQSDYKNFTFLPQEKWSF